jgi:hypothetical protein
MRGATLAIDGKAAAGLAGVNAQPQSSSTRWWQPVVPVSGGARTSVVDAAVHAQAAAHLAAGDITQGWRVLADHGDGIARLVSSTVGTAPSTVYAQTTDAHWHRVTGSGVDGDGYRAAVASLLEAYLGHSARTGSLPSTEDVEAMDRIGLAQQGLPAVLAMGAVQSRIAFQYNSDFSWGRAMGLPPERVAHRSTVFADVDFDGTQQMLLTAAHAVKRYGLNRTLSYDGAASTLRGLRQGGALSVSSAVLATAQAAAQQGDVAGAWRELGRHGDDYARSAAKIVGQQHAPHDFLAAAVEAHWHRLLGPQQTAQHFDQVAATHLNNYLQLVANHDGALPGTRAIERSYRDALEAAGLPAAVAIDSLFSRADHGLADSWLAKVGIDSFSWGSVCGMPAARIDTGSDVFADLDIDVTAELLSTSMETLKRHPSVVLRLNNIGYPWNAVRALFG